MSIIIELKGGLGNQLFQMSFGYSLSSYFNSKLYFFPFVPKNSPSHASFSYSHIFQNSFNFLSARSLSKLSPFISIERSRRLVSKSNKLSNWFHFYQEPRLSFCPEIFSQSDTLYFRGYWQSFKYFSHLREHILDAFKFRVDNVSDLELLRGFDISNSVFLHVRRGDYISNSSARKVHYIDLHTYYDRAISYFRQRILSPQFFIFSDDIVWCKNNFNGSEFTFVSHNSSLPHIDLYLMSLFRYHIIANSTYSWWGAWSCPDNSSVTVAPSTWSKLTEHKVSDLYPNSWILL